MGEEGLHEGRRGAWEYMNMSKVLPLVGLEFCQFLCWCCVGVRWPILVFDIFPTGVYKQMVNKACVSILSFPHTHTLQGCWP